MLLLLHMRPIPQEQCMALWKSRAQPTSLRSLTDVYRRALGTQNGCRIESAFLLLPAPAPLPLLLGFHE